MADFILGRQQIFDRKLNVYGYELLFRSCQQQNHAQIVDGTVATNHLIVDALLECGLENLTNGNRAFINLTAENVLQGVAQLLPRDKVVIEILEDAPVTPLLVEAVTNLANQGYLIALDDFVFDPQWQPLVELASIIKIDVLAQPDEQALIQLIQKLQRYPLRILAEKIETPEQYQHFLDLGCDYFQGYFFHKPNLVSGKRLKTNQQHLFRVLGEINREDVDIHRISALISQEVGLSYKLLKFINSAHFSLPRKIRSIEQAIVLMGLLELKRWINLITLTQVSENCPLEILRISLIRAKMCELLARRVDHCDPEAFFLTGLFSNLEQMLEQPMENIISDLPLADPIKQGLSFNGEMGEALRCAVNYELWDLDNAAFDSLEISAIGDLYLQSIRWAQQILSELH
ncbi:MAG: hypothetical protein AXA67_11605 [Methylothermaceae bacteria B42]|nr:MAG: hypothetical protein AXA67_11605 [Methylothermaceae bacteria B42]HHJ39177.1 HDOD domain-containing protein [Methylothermaceae bacterium]